MPKEYKDDMTRESKSDKELHDIIKKHLCHPKMGAKIFDALLEETVNRKTIGKKQLAHKLGTDASAPNFFYR